jgi:hypothetical protein
MRYLLLAVCGLSAVGCAVPKVLVDHSYATSDKSLEILIQRSGEAVGTGQNKTNLFNVFMRVCNQGADNTQANCKDSVILENVDPRSL